MDPAARCTTGGLIAYASAGGARENGGDGRGRAPTPARPSSPPSWPYVSRASGSTAWPSSCAASQPAANSATAGASGASMPIARAATIVRTSSSAPSGIASQPGWYSQQRVVHEDVERQSDPGHQSGDLHRPPRAHADATATASASVSSTGASRDSIRPLSVYDIAPPVSGIRAPRTWRRRACRRRETPTVRGRRRLRACATRR